jgi:hypothetical protein
MGRVFPVALALALSAAGAYAKSPNVCADPSKWTPHAIFYPGTTCENFNEMAASMFFNGVNPNTISRRTCGKTVNGTHYAQYVENIASKCCSGTQSICMKDLPSICSKGQKDFIPNKAVGGIAGNTGTPCNVLAAYVGSGAKNKNGKPPMHWSALTCASTVVADSQSGLPVSAAMVMEANMNECCHSGVTACGTLRIPSPCENHADFKPDMVLPGSSGAPSGSTCGSIARSLYDHAVVARGKDILNWNPGTCKLQFSQDTTVGTILGFMGQAGCCSAGPTKCAL